MTATAPVKTLAERTAMFQKFVDDIRANLETLRTLDRTGYVYSFRAVPGFAMHVDRNGMIGLTASRANLLTTRLPGVVFRNGKGDVAEFMPMGEAVDLAIAEAEKNVGEFIELGKSYGLTVA